MGGFIRSSLNHGVCIEDNLLNGFEGVLLKTDWASKNYVVAFIILREVCDGLTTMGTSDV